MRKERRKGTNGFGRWLLTIFVGLVAMSVSIAGALCNWTFYAVDDFIAEGFIVADDIYENYVFNQGTKNNSKTFTLLQANQKGSSLKLKLLGGYTEGTSSSLDYSNDALYSFDEFNFYVSSTDTINTIDAGYGRLFYIDRAFFTQRSSSNKNVSPTNTYSDGTNTVSFNISAKESGYLIAKDANGDASSSYLQIRKQKNLLNTKYGDSDTFTIFKKDVLDNVNKVVYNNLDNFWFNDENNTITVDGSTVSVDDNITSFNYSSSGSNYTLTNLPATSSISASDIVDGAGLNNKFFTPGKNASTEYGYFNMLLFVPFERTYDFTNNTSTLKYDSDGNTIEEDFGFVSITSAYKEDSSKGSWIKVIDYSDYEEGITNLPSIYNGGLKLDGNYLAKSNFANDGKYFVDTLNLDEDGNPTYRRVLGVSNNIQDHFRYTYAEPTFSGSERQFYLGSQVTSMATYYMNDIIVDSNTEESQYVFNVDDFVSSTYARNFDMKLVNHMTYSDELVYDETVGDSGYSINFDMSKLLLWVPGSVTELPTN